MSVIISPIITNAGLGVFTPMATGIEFTFTHVAVGTGTSAATAAAVALENEIARFPIAGGGIVTGGQSVSINALITNHTNANPQDYDITEFGFYGVDSNTNIVLFAIYRTDTTIVRKVSGADISAPFVMGLAALPTNNMTVQIDANASAMLALLGQHVANIHPHTQYKRTLDNTERLKIADAVNNDEAVSKGQLDVEITNRENADTDLQNTKANLGGSNTQRFKVADAVNNDEAVSKGQLLLGVEQGADYFKLPDFIGGWKIKFGHTFLGDDSPATTHTTTITGFTEIKTVLIGSTTSDNFGAFTYHRQSFDNNSVTVVFDEWSSQIQNGVGYWWLAIGK